ncbi:FlgD immunoglobulin-like domain containing protein [Candidatus Eisenbacteria bacterium]|uniref:mannan endo-1,4-beta-mannosidase n=1 Tax=Eiseniibacteriota bacterium TaxID=2212470 RepID=A0ABV6YJJ5_UNCEI
MSSRLAIAFWTLTAICGLGGSAGEEFIRTDGSSFFVGQQPYYYAGANFWQAVNLASEGTGGDRARLLRELDQLDSLGVSNLRIMAGSEGPDTEPWRMIPSLQPVPGVYNSDLLDGLDFVLKELGERDMHAILCLTNFWHWSGGMAQYVSWNGSGAIPYPPPEPGGDWDTFQDYSSDFYSNAGAKQDFLNHVTFLLERVNSYTGVVYRDEPAIMAWELANEPRGFHNNATAFNQWIDETAAYIKSIDANHMVTTGCEGNTPWPSWNGLDFLANHDGSNIDYTTIHIWPQNWGWYDPDNPAGTYGPAVLDARAYLQSHESLAVSLQKPLVLEEFGFARDSGSFDPASTTAWRDSFLNAMYDEVYASASSEGAAAGSNFWSWAGEGRPLEPYGSHWSNGDPWTGDPPHEAQGWYSVYDTDSSTLSAVAFHAQEMTGLIPFSTTHSLRMDDHELRASPNPFNQKTAIRFDIPGSGTYVLTILDPLGRTLAEFIGSHRGSGKLSYGWDGTDQTGRKVASGVYLVKMETSSYSARSRIALIR